MADIKVVTDSTSDLPDDLIQKMGIRVLPVSIVIDGHSYRDEVDITSDTFYENIESYGKVHSQEITYTDYAYIYKELASKHDHLLIIHCSRDVSLTYDNAEAVHNDFHHTHGSKVALFDSGQCGLGLGMLVLEAAKAVQAGSSFSEVVEMVNRRIPNIYTYFYVPTLYYLRKGRKISGMKSVLGSAMGISPVLSFEGGSITMKGRITREESKVPVQLMEVMQKDLEGHSLHNLGIAHAHAPDLAGRMKELMFKTFSCDQVYESYVGTAIGLNTGPGAVGVMCTTK